jgi:hypothetical protein
MWFENRHKKAPNRKGNYYVLYYEEEIMVKAWGGRGKK